MRKTVLWLLAVVCLLSGCGAEQPETEPVDYDRYVAAFTQVWAEREPREQALQRDLARWYNVNLRSENPEPGFAEAYSSILFYENGIMGYLELSSSGRRIPIFHGAGSLGFRHDPNSAFPIGGVGNHTVLRCDETLSLPEGATFVLWVLDQRLTYRVGEAGEDLCTLICGGDTYTAGRVVED